MKIVPMVDSMIRFLFLASLLIHPARAHASAGVKAKAGGKGGAHGVAAPSRLKKTEVRLGSVVGWGRQALTLYRAEESGAVLRQLAGQIERLDRASEEELYAFALDPAGAAQELASRAAPEDAAAGDAAHWVLRGLLAEPQALREDRTRSNLEAVLGPDGLNKLIEVSGRLDRHADAAARLRIWRRLQRRSAEDRHRIKTQDVVRRVLQMHRIALAAFRTRGVADEITVEAGGVGKETEGARLKPAGSVERRSVLEKIIETQGKGLKPDQIRVHFNSSLNHSAAKTLMEGLRVPYDEERWTGEFGLYPEFHYAARLPPSKDAASAAALALRLGREDGIAYVEARRELVRRLRKTGKSSVPTDVNAARRSSGTSPGSFQRALLHMGGLGLLGFAAGAGYPVWTGEPIHGFVEGFRALFYGLAAALGGAVAGGLLSARRDPGRRPIFRRSGFMLAFGLLGLWAGYGLSALTRGDPPGDVFASFPWYELELARLILLSLGGGALGTLAGGLFSARRRLRPG